MWNTIGQELTTLIHHSEVDSDLDTRLLGDTTLLVMLMTVNPFRFHTSLPKCRCLHMTWIGTNTQIPDDDPLDQCAGKQSQI